jgi:hypothetical protein
VGSFNVRFDATAIRGHRDIIGGAAQTLAQSDVGASAIYLFLMFECSIARGMAQVRMEKCNIH